MASTLNIGHIDQTCNEIMQQESDVFGGMGIIFVGDQLQLPCVKGETIPKGMVRSIMTKESALRVGSKNKKEADDLLFGPNTPVGKGREVLKSFKHIVLTELHRAEDPLLRDCINQMRNLNTLYPIKLEMFRHLKVLSPEDIEQDKTWIGATIGTTTNSERFFLNPLLLKNLSIVSGNPLLRWRKRFKNKNIYTPLKKGYDTLAEYLYKAPEYDQELWQYFCRGSIVDYLDNGVPKQLKCGEIIIGKSIDPASNVANGTFFLFFFVFF